jgi:hypothetical protein
MSTGLNPSPGCPPIVPLIPDIDLIKVILHCLKMGGKIKLFVIGIHIYFRNFVKILINGLDGAF